MFAGIETGGTKTVCAVGADGAIEHRTQFPTGSDPVALALWLAEHLAAQALVLHGSVTVPAGSRVPVERG